MASLDIGLIGCGFIGRFHSTAIRSLIRGELVDARYVAVCDVDIERARSFAEVTGARLVTSEWREVVESPDVSVVYVCVPTAGHMAIVLRAAQLGKHVFCEKPLATNVEDVEEMVEVVRGSGVKAGVGLVLRHSPILTVLKSISDDPALGRLMAITFRDDQFFPIQGHYTSDWRKDRTLAGAGTLLEHSIHDVDILRWFGGEVSTVRGTVRNYAGHEGVEDLVVAQLEFAGGGQAQLTSVWHNVLSRPSSRRIELFFEGGFFHIESDFSGSISFQKHAESAVVLSEEEVRERYLAAIGADPSRFGDALQYSLEDYFFLDAVAQDREPFPDFDAALSAHRIVDAIYRSAASDGLPISLS